MKMWTSSVFGLLGLIFGVSPAFSQAPSFSVSPSMVAPATDGKVWGGLIYASNVEVGGMDKKLLPSGLQDLSQRLSKVFSFTHFELLGHHNQDVFRQYESWVVPSRDLFLKVDSKGPAEGGGVNLHLQFWQEQQVLVKTDAMLRVDSPLFIGGPKWKDGQLIFVLMLTRQEK
jgi:hypothetical protein